MADMEYSARESGYGGIGTIEEPSETTADVLSLVLDKEGPAESPRLAVGLGISTILEGLYSLTGVRRMSENLSEKEKVEDFSLEDDMFVDMEMRREHRYQLHS